MEKATRALQQPVTPAAPAPRTIPTAGPTPPDDNNFLFLRVDHQWVRIDLDTLLYIESLRDYVRIVTKTKTYIVHLPLADLTARLPPERFIRVHRSFTLALDRVDRVSQHCAHIGDKHIPISRAHRQEVYRRLGP